MYRALGHEVVSAAFRELSDKAMDRGSAVTEAAIYQAFLGNTPTPQRDRFRLSYSCLHGRQIPGYTPVSTPTAPLSERDALVAFYHATNGPGWKNSKNWLTDAPLDQWHGVSIDCDGSLTGLALFNNQLTGPMPPELSSLSGLAALLLKDNQLTGPIPPELASLSNLTSLSLEGNQLTGPVPPKLSSLSNLTSPSLHQNRLTGPIPPALASLSKLIYLALENNGLTGPIPPELAGLSNLTHLMLQENQLTGLIPAELASLSNLRHLLLGANRLTGCVPQGLEAVENNDLHSLGLKSC